MLHNFGVQIAADGFNTCHEVGLKINFCQKLWRGDWGGGGGGGGSPCLFSRLPVHIQRKLFSLENTKREIFFTSQGQTVVVFVVEMEKLEKGIDVRKEKSGAKLAHLA